MSNMPNATTQADSRSIPGVFIANIPFQKLKRHLVLGVVILPMIGLMIAIALLWRRGIGPVDVILCMGMYAITILGISVGFHRHFAHRSFQASDWMRVILIVLGSMAVQGPVLTWVAIHRRHHRYSDKYGDPHSPYLFSNGEQISSLWKGFWHSHLG